MNNCLARETSREREETKEQEEWHAYSTTKDEKEGLNNQTGRSKAICATQKKETSVTHTKKNCHPKENQSVLHGVKGLRSHPGPNTTDSTARTVHHHMYLGNMQRMIMCRKIKNEATPAHRCVGFENMSHLVREQTGSGLRNKGHTLEPGMNSP